MCRLSAFLICLLIMTNLWLTLPDWTWLFIEFNLQLICVHLFVSELAWKKKKKEERAWDFGKALHLMSLLSCENLIGNETVISFMSYSIRYIQNCDLESCFLLAGDFVNILLLLVFHVLDFMTERGFRLEGNPNVPLKRLLGSCRTFPKF